MGEEVGELLGDKVGDMLCYWLKRSKNTSKTLN